MNNTEINKKNIEAIIEAGEIEKYHPKVLDGLVELNFRVGKRQHHDLSTGKYRETTELRIFATKTHKFKRIWKNLKK